MAQNTQHKPCSSYGYSDDPWMWEDSVYVLDGYYAYSSVTGQTSSWGGFGFEIPYQATITGVEVKITAKVGTDCGISKPVGSSVYITSTNWAIASVAKKLTLSNSTWTEFTFGGSSDMWYSSGVIPMEHRPYGINNEFSVNVTSNLGGTWNCLVGGIQELWIDYITAAIYYTMPDSPHPFQTTLKGRRNSPGG
jgi:hypothetical protein